MNFKGVGDKNLETIFLGEINEDGHHQKNLYYTVPKYQRQYAWDKWARAALFNDLLENGKGYFIGSIICINKEEDSSKPCNYEVIDGQQRLVTVSLLLAAIYSKASDLDESEDRTRLLESIKGMLVRKSSPSKLVITPQEEGHNLSDFAYVMKEIGIEADDPGWAKGWGNRKIAEGFKQFKDLLAAEMEKSPDKLECLIKIKGIIDSAIVVRIEVGNLSDAYALFEALNNRGTPLSSIDLLKTTLLERCGKVEPNLDVNSTDKEWGKIIECLGDSLGLQERFFRQYYNAFSKEIRERNPSVPLATSVSKSNLLSEYKKLIGSLRTRDELRNLLIDLGESARCYSAFLKEEGNGPLVDLLHIQGAPSYTLLLFLYRKKAELELDDGSLSEIVNLLVKFFVRRNLTDVPPTRDLSRLFVSLVNSIKENNLKGNAIYGAVLPELKKSLGPNADELFSQKLRGDIYTENWTVTRFFLCHYEKRHETRENPRNLWEKGGKTKRKSYVWTIEHVFPEGRNVPQCWVDMIAGGDKEKAKQYRGDYVHKLGNLTLSAYNSDLSNASFEEKRDHKDGNGNPNGYKNGLKLNEALATKTEWTIKDIEERTEILADEFMKEFSI